MIFDDIIRRRGVPALRFDSAEDFEAQRERIKELISENEYGYIPKAPDHLSVKIENKDSRFAAGKARKQTIILTAHNGNETFSFPVTAVIPNGISNAPAFVYIDFEEDVPGKYMPSEEIADNGFAVFSFCYKNIISDDADFSGEAAEFLKINRHVSSAPGKIAIWAWAAMRVMDYVEGLDFTDKEHIAVIGHSRLGKTALLAAAFDERFKYAISNDSGCSGAAITRGKRGEQITDITNVFPYWFCPRYSKLAESFSLSGFDQNFLLSLIAPRRLMIGSAENDIWADPESEFLGAYSVSKIYELYGLDGLIHKESFPTVGEVLDKGSVSYHLRAGEHYLSRDDWHVYMNYIKKQRNKTYEL